MARVKVVTEEELPDGVPDAATAPARAFTTVDTSMFPNVGLDPKKVPGGIGVTRIDPADGYIGHFPAGTTKDDLKRLVGGYVLSLDLKDGLGHPMPGCKDVILRIDAPPVATAEAKARIAELKKGGTGETGDILERVMAVQRVALEEMKRQSQDHAAILRAELESSSKRRQDDAEASLTRMREEAKIRADEADAKHKRELELTRAYTDAQMTREREQRALEKAQHTEMIGMIQANNARQTEVVVASLGNKTDAMGVIKEMFTLAIPLLPLLSGQGDPAVEITKAVSGSLESMAKLASNDRHPSDDGKKPTGKELAKTNGGGSKPAIDAPDKKTRMLAKIGKLMQSVNAAGHDPEAMLDQAIGHYDAQAGAGGQLEPGDDGTEVEERRQERQTPEHAPKRAGRSSRRRTKSVSLAGRPSRKPKPTGKSAVGRRAKTHGRPAPKSSTRRDTAGSKRKRKT